MEVCMISGEEAKNVRPLWEEAFSHDSRAFTEYYFDKKVSNNIVFVGKEGEEICSMVHLTPYLTNRNEEVCYMVGVATKEEYRRQGFMSELLREAFACMQSESEPFVFLMPADPKIYEPFGFTYVYAKEEQKLNPKRLSEKLLNEAAKNEGEFTLLVKRKGLLTVRTVRENEVERVSRYANAYLEKNNDFYLLRSAQYYRTMKAELIAQNGNLFLLEHNGIIKGLLSYTNEKEAYVQEALFEEELNDWDFFEKKEAKPQIMARIINVKEMLRQVKSPKEFVLALKINDIRFPENDGLYMIHCGPMGGNLTAIKIGENLKTNSAGECCMAEAEVTIENLTAFLFGYRTAKECFKIYHADKKESLCEALSTLNVIRKPCMNEIV